MSRRSLCAAAAIAAAGVFSPYVVTAQRPNLPVCTVADRPATFLDAAAPTYDGGDFMNGFGSFFAQVNVAVDATGKATEADVRYSTNSALRQRAIAAAMQSTYRPALKNCTAVASHYIATIAFDGSHGFVGSGVGEVIAPVGYAEIVFVDTGDDDDLATAGLQSRAKIDALRDQLTRTETKSARILSDDYSIRARDTQGGRTAYETFRSVRIRVNDLREVPSTYRLIRGLMHYENLGVVLHPKNAEDAYDRAFALALVNARADADNMAAGAQHHTGRLGYAETLNVYSSSWMPGDSIPAEMNIIISISADFTIAP